MGIRSLLRKVFGRDRAEGQADTPATSVPSQASPSRQEDATPTPPPTQDEAQHAAADLVAAAFDNPKVPAARTAGKPAAEEEPPVAELPKQATPEAAEKPAEEVPAAEVAEEPAEAVTATEEPATAEKPAEAVPAEPQTGASDVSEPEAGAAETADEPQAEAARTVDAPAEEVVAEAETSQDEPVADEAVADEAKAEAAQDEPVTETPAADVAETPEQVAAEPQAEAAAETVEATAEAEAAQAPVADTVVAEVAAEPQAEAAAETVDAPAEPQAEAAKEPAATEPESEPEATPAEALTAQAVEDEPEATEAEAHAAEPEATPADEAVADEPVAAEVEADATAEPVAAETPTTPGRTVLTSDAPQLVGAYDAAAGALAERGLVGAGPVAVYLVVDRSGSMRGYFKDGSVQRIAEQTVALAAHLTEDAAVTAVFFSTDIDGTAELRPAGIEGRIDEINAGLGRLGRTNYHRAVEEVLAHHEKTDPTRPAFVVFQTDGAPESKTAATQALAEAAGRPIHWQFVAWGEEDNKAFDFVRKLTAPRTGHYLAGPTPAETAHADFYRGLLSTWEA
ncbi:VWA domain-containing protein [Streptomyces sp. NPDC013457]|uniref:VWA domain-containing protein n=1 Tax=Streptomyces sp. NPDC013457 TaxID=3364866 RepID=UPI0036FE5FA5